ncbi:hypothetical protein Tco_0720172, partial [Tanacetum coccineum]
METSHENSFLLLSLCVEKNAVQFAVPGGLIG